MTVTLKFIRLAQTTLIESLDAKYEMQIEQLDMLRAQVEEVSR